MSILSLINNFDTIILKTPKEGIMGLTKDKKPIILHNGDMISTNALDRQFLELLYVRGMIMLCRIVDTKDIKPENSIVYKNRKRKKLTRKYRGKNNGSNLMKWFDNNKLNGFKR